MNALAVLVAFVLVQLWGSGGRLHRDDWFVAGYRWVLQVPAGWLRVALVVSPPLMTVVIIQYLLAGLWLGFALLGFQVLVLLYAMGRGDFHKELKAYLRSWHMGDIDSARDFALPFVDALGENETRDELALHEAMRKGVFYRGFERWFVVVFWFVLLGPMLCVAYRLLYLLARHPAAEAPDRQLCSNALYYLEWLPLRFIAPVFCLVGNFERCAAQLNQTFLSAAPAEELLDEWGRAALQELVPEGLAEGERFRETAVLEVRGAGLLMSRSALVWLVLLMFVQFF